jgi:hypothetical protein
MGSRYIDLHFLDFGTCWRPVASFTPLTLYPQVTSPEYPMNRRLGGIQRKSLRYREVMISYPTETEISNPSVVQPVANRCTDCTTPAPYKRCSGERVQKQLHCCTERAFMILCFCQAVLSFLAAYLRLYFFVNLISFLLNSVDVVPMFRACSRRIQLKFRVCRHDGLCAFSFQKTA